MPKTYVKPVRRSWKSLGTIGGRPSTIAMPISLVTARQRVQPSFLHDLFHYFTSHLSPPKNLVLPLIEHYLYPVSTAPTINPNQINLKKGSI